MAFTLLCWFFISVIGAQANEDPTFNLGSNAIFSGYDKKHTSNNNIIYSNEDSKRLWILQTNLWGIDSASKGSFTTISYFNKQIVIDVNMKGMKGTYAYPDLHYGKLGKLNTEQNPSLPIRMDKIQNITITTNYELESREMHGNIAYDVFFSNTKDEKIGEMMIWLYSNDMTPIGEKKKFTENIPVIINGNRQNLPAEVYIDNTKKVFTYMFANSQIPENTDLKFSLTMLSKNALEQLSLPTNSNLTFVQLGSEFTASGDQKYTVKFNKFDISEDNSFSNSYIEVNNKNDAGMLVEILIIFISCLILSFFVIKYIT